MYSVTLLPIHITIVAVETQKMHSVCVVQLQVTVSSVNILSVAQKCFYVEFMLPETERP